MSGLKSFRSLCLAIFCFAFTNGANAQDEGFTIAYQTQYFPYSWQDSAGVPSGILIDWWELWATKANVRVEFSPGTVRECVDKVYNRKADVAAGLFYNNTQSDSLLFADEIIRVRTALFLKKSVRPKSVYEVTDSIGLLADGISTAHILSQYPELKLKLFRKGARLEEAIQNREVAGFFWEIPSPLVKIKRRYVPKGYYEYMDVQATALRPAVRARNTDLLNRIQDGSNQITDEELLAIARKHELVPVNGLLPWIIAVGVLSVVALMLLIMRFRPKNKGIKPISGLGPDRDWLVIIDKGESDRIEFKSSLRWDFREEKLNKALESVIIKTISAFLNTEGGMLFIGVDDGGNILGIDNDYSVIHQGNADGFLLVMTNLINKHFGKHVHRLVHANIVSVNGRDICIVEVQKSEKPVFIRKGESEEFYIRASAASVPLGMREASDYIRGHWSG